MKELFNSTPPGCFNLYISKMHLFFTPWFYSRNLYHTRQWW